MRIFTLFALPAFLAAALLYGGPKIVRGYAQKVCWFSSCPVVESERHQAPVEPPRSQSKSHRVDIAKDNKTPER